MELTCVECGAPAKYGEAIEFWPGDRYFEEGPERFVGSAWCAEHSPFAEFELVPGPFAAE